MPHDDDDDDDDSTVCKCVYLYRMKEGMSAYNWLDCDVIDHCYCCDCYWCCVSGIMTMGVCVSDGCHHLYWWWFMLSAYECCWSWYMNVDSADACSVFLHVLCGYYSWFGFMLWCCFSVVMSFVFADTICDVSVISIMIDASWRWWWWWWFHSM